MRQHALLKACGTTIFMSLFFVAYFYILRHPMHTVTPIPQTAVDRLVPYYPPAFLLYASLWFYVGIPPALMRTVRELVVYGLWIGGLCTAGLTIFLLWPTEVPSQVLDVGQFPGMKILAGVDAKANACPSLHVATALFSAMWLNRIFGDVEAPLLPRAANWIWCAAITYSTLAIKQHLAIDAAGGIVLALVVGLVSLGFVNRRPPQRVWAGVWRGQPRRD